MNVDKEDVKKAMDHIDAPDSLYEFAKSVPYIEDQHTLPINKKKRKAGKAVQLIIGTAAALTLAIGSGYVSPTMAQMLKEVPIVGSLFTESDSEIVQNAVEKGFVSDISGTTQSNSGITVDFSEVYYDGKNLSIGYTLTFEQLDLLEKEVRVPFRPMITLDGKQQNHSSSFEEVEQNGNVVKGIMHARFQPQEAKTVQLMIHEVYGQKGEWAFDLPIENENIHQASYVYKPKTIQEWKEGNSTITIEEMHVKPGHTQVVLSQEPLDPNKKMTSLNQKGMTLYDENGTSIFNMYSPVEPLDNGKYSASFPELPSTYESLILDVVTTGTLKLEGDPTVKEYHVQSDDTLPKRIPIINDQSMIIEAINETADMITVRYELKGDINLQSQYIAAYDSHNPKHAIQEASISRVDTNDEKLVFERTYKKDETFTGKALLTISVDEEIFTRKSVRIDVPLKD